jgi:hypothetical protein
MNDPVYQQFRELNWRRGLTESEAAGLRELLAAHPEAREDWELETALSRALTQLPAAPLVASNFTAQVLQTVEREASARARTDAKPAGAWRSLWNWLPRAAVTGVAVGLGIFAYDRHLTNARVEVAHDVAELSELVSATNPDLMEDFESIRRLGDAQPKADTELLFLMK